MRCQERGRQQGERTIRKRQETGGLQDSSPVPLVAGAGDASRVIGSSLFQPPLTRLLAPPNSPFQSLRPPLLLSPPSLFPSQPPACQG